MLAKTRVSPFHPLGDNGSVSNNAQMELRNRPELGRDKTFIVQCEGYRCMAYRDAAGKWRDYFNGEEIQGEVTVLSAA